MELRIFTEPQQGYTYGTQAAFAQLTEELGFDAYFRSDHYINFTEPHAPPGPTDSWITLAALARETNRVRLGTLVTSATFRLPGVLAMQVAQVDEMSGGRVDLGIGTGWNDIEHTAYGIPFHNSFGERFEHLVEQLEIIKGLWTTKPGENFNYQGKHYTLKDSPALPKPVQDPHPPIIIGGVGAKRTPRLAAKYADEFNIPFMPVHIVAERVQAVRDACEKIGRDPDSIVMSSAQVTCIGKDDDEFKKRAANIGQNPDNLKAGGVGGLPSDARAKLEQLAEAGITRMYLQVLDLSDHDHLRIVAAELLGGA